ncbi:glycosyltransferase [Salinibacterium sp. ZJ454]|uniref:glycosyltransferase n=1 Tax=Salinibacterium sp. ZJ454 TaxID=2708339 RepID=UPI00141EAA8B|nr:glycosyltransferase [Salinibacterium sp. ZJ454]
MIAYGICIGTEAKYDTVAKPSLELYAPTSTVFERRDQSSIFKAYNSILDEARRANVQGLVLMHEDVELLEPIEGVLIREFADPTVAIVGAIGGKGVRSVRWSKSAERFGRAPDTFHGANDLGGGSHDVDLVDGLLLALSPWAIHNLRFDEARFRGFHAYDADICMQARQEGKRVRTTDLNLLHHTKGGFGNLRAHHVADDKFRRKWGIPLDSWKYRHDSRRNNQPY